jgi:hypothetical protein
MRWDEALAYTAAACAVSFLLTLMIAISERRADKGPTAAVVRFPRRDGKSETPA